MPKLRAASHIACAFVTISFRATSFRATWERRDARTRDRSGGGGMSRDGGLARQGRARLAAGGAGRDHRFSRRPSEILGLLAEGLAPARAVATQAPAQ